jgi:hypothetical protein
MPAPEVINLTNSPPGTKSRRRVQDQIRRRAGLLDRVERPQVKKNCIPKSNNKMIPSWQWQLHPIKNRIS